MWHPCLRRAKKREILHGWTFEVGDKNRGVFYGGLWGGKGGTRGEKGGPRGDPRQRSCASLKSFSAPSPPNSSEQHWTLLSHSSCPYFRDMVSSGLPWDFDAKDSTRPVQEKSKSSCRWAFLWRTCHWCCPVRITLEAIKPLLYLDGWGKRPTPLTLLLS